MVVRLQMKIRYRQSGGLAGVVKVAEVDPRDLSAADAGALIETARKVESLPLALPGTSSGADEEQITVEVHDDSRVITRHFSARNIPASIASLVRTIAAKARYLKRE